MTCDLLVDGAAIVSVDPEWRIFDPGWVAVDEGAIVGIGPCPGESLGPGHSGGAALAGPVSTPARPPFEPRRRIDGRGKLVLPGFVNTHTHVPMAAFKGAGEDVRDRLTRYIFPMEKALVDAELVYAASRFCLAEMARSGTTTFADMYYFEEEVARAAKEAGLRCLLGETVVDFPAPDAEEPYGGIARARRFVGEWRGDPLVRPCLAPHAPYTVDAEHLRAIRGEAERLGVPAMMHVAEMDHEAARFAASHGSTIRYLDSVGFLWPGLLAAHMIRVDDRDIELAASRGISVAHCPASNAKSGRPIAPAYKCLGAGVRLGLATDGPLSGNGMDLQGVLGLFPKLQKVLAGKRDVVPAREALRAATLGGAEALGLGDLIGSLETGKRADLAIYDATGFDVQPVYDWYSAAVYCLRPQDARVVIVDGRVVFEDGAMTGFDEAEAKAAMRRVAARCRGEIERLSEEVR